MESNELSCQEVVALVTDYLEQVLLPEIQTAVDEHVAGCPGCRTYYDQMQQTLALLRQLTQ